MTNEFLWWIEQSRASPARTSIDAVSPEVWDTTKRVPPAYNWRAPLRRRPNMYSPIREMIYEVDRAVVPDLLVVGLAWSSTVFLTGSGGCQAAVEKFGD
jgi:hypothetical protein